MIGLYFAVFDRERITGSAIAIAAGIVVFAVVYMYTRAAQLKLGFTLTMLGSLALIVIGAFGMSDAGAAVRYQEEDED